MPGICALNLIYIYVLNERISEILINSLIFNVVLCTKYNSCCRKAEIPFISVALFAQILVGNSLLHQSHSRCGISKLK